MAGTVVGWWWRSDPILSGKNWGGGDPALRGGSRHATGARRLIRRHVPGGRSVPAPVRPVRSPVVAVQTTHDGHGYWVTSADDSVYNYGNAPFLGSLSGLHLVAPVVGMAAPGA
jgi:hypothetical protein